MRKPVIMLSAAALISGCAGIQQQSFKLSDGRMVDYLHGKIDADGQTGVFRDAYIDGTPVLSHFGSGQSLLGQVLQGTASSAMIAGGMVGAAAVLRPTRINETNNLNNDQDQGQSMHQGQLQGQSTKNHISNTSVNVNENDNKNTAKAGAAAGAVAVNHNENKAYGGAGGHGGNNGHHNNHDD